MNPSRQRDTSDCPAIGFSPSPAAVECCGAVSVRLCLKQKMNNKRDVGGNKKSLPLRLQGQYIGGVQKRLSEIPPQSARTAQRKSKYVQLHIAVTRGNLFHQYNSNTPCFIVSLLFHFCVSERGVVECLR